MSKKVITILFFIVVALSLVFAQPVQEAPKAEEQRIVSLGPNLTETICALGAGNELVGRTDYCDYPASVSAVQSVGDLYNPNLELIVSLRPTLVLCSSIISPETVASLRNAGLTVESINPQETLEGTYLLIETVGSLLGKEKEAEELNASIRDRIQKVGEKVANVEKRSVYYCVGYGEWGDYTATGDTFVHGILTSAGGNNIASSASYWMFDKESLVALDPEVFLLPVYSYSYPEGDMEALKGTEPYSTLSAVKGDGIRLVDGNLLDRQGPRIAEAVEMVATILYPELF